MKIFARILLALSILSLSSPAFALDLNQARTQGIIGEQRDGYVKVLKPSADAQALANEVNARRKEEYARISRENGQAVNVVSTLAAQQIIQKLSAGSMYQDANGAWVKK